MKRKKNSRDRSPVDVLGFLLKEERRSGVILLFSAIVALIIANSAWSDSYLSLIHHQLSLGSITLDLRHWISEGLMASFFLVVVLEVKREFIDGELSTWRKASFPFFAAVGGMLVPALIYITINPLSPQNAGWAIPVATDIAIAIGALALLGDKIPRSLRIFLLALAIIDDIGSIVIIALFYSHPTNTIAIFGSIFFTLTLLLFRNKKFWVFGFAIMGLCIWYCLLLAGVSGTLAGVLVAALMPLTKHRKGSPLQLSERIEDMLLPATAYIIVPLFVFTSTGLVFSQLALQQDRSFMVFMGVVVGLVIGKPLGIISVSWFSAKLRLAHKPESLSWGHIMGVSVLAGVGFTVSLLIADLSFSNNTALQNVAVLGVFVASVLSGSFGIIFLRRISR